MREPVLLIEENSIDALAIRRAYARLDNSPELIIFKTAMEALDYLGSKENSMPGLIIHDLNMGKMNAHTFLKTIRSDRRLEKIPVVIVTTSSKHQDFISCFEFDDVIGYFVKPVDYFDLIKSIAASRSDDSDTKGKKGPTNRPALSIGL